MISTVHHICKEEIQKAADLLGDIVTRTPLSPSLVYSERYNCTISFKREDLQVVRSYKIRGAFNKINSLTSEQKEKGIVCASAGNHAQGVAYTCNKLRIIGKIFMPNTTPAQKVSQVRMFGKEYVEVILAGDTFDDAYRLALKACELDQLTFVHPFDDEKIMAGQGTVGLEILQDTPEPIDYLFLPIGGGGLASGVGSIFKELSPATKIIGIEPEGAPAMKRSVEAGHVIHLDQIDKFVDGASVKCVGELTFPVVKEVIDEIITVPEGKICTTILNLYNEEAIVVEPAGAMSITALDTYKNEIYGKNVVCIVSGGNNDITRTEEIKERSLLYEGLKHYFILRFPQRAGALREFLVNVLGPNDDIAHFEYTKKTSRDRGPALVGIEVKRKEDYAALIKRMDDNGINYTEVNKSPDLFTFLI